MQSQVYKARWQGLLVAVKILNAEESAQQEEFKKEVAMLEALRHPHIVNYLGHLFQDSGEVRAVPAPEHITKDAQGLNIETPRDSGCTDSLVRLRQRQHPDWLPKWL